jgi:tripartite-type tricarboxylate transporter receptor subunit TctC
MLIRMLATLVAVFVTHLAAAQAPTPAYAFPTKPMRIVIPFGPGGGSEVAARSLADQMSRTFGQSVVVENRPGGNSVIASEIVAKAPADGHTLLLTTDFHAINAAFGIALPYDSLGDFAFVAQLTTSPLMLVAHPSTGAKTLGELIERAKANPGKLSFASLGSSSPHHLGFEWFKRLAGVEMIDVPYKGGGQALADVLGGQVNLMYVVTGNGIRQARAGKLVALAVTSDKRHSVAPETPSIAESGFPGYSLVNWYAMLAPGGTPKDVVAKLNAEILRALKLPAVIERLNGAGLDATPSSPEELEAHVRREIDKYRRIIQMTGAKPEGR